MFPPFCSCCLPRNPKQAALVDSGTAVPEHLAVQLPPAAQAAAAAPDSSVALATVLERSRQLCLLQYEREQYNPHSFMELFTKLNAILTDEQLSVFAGGLLGWLWLWQANRNRKSGWLCVNSSGLAHMRRPC
jgi:hypothetical protein